MYKCVAYSIPVHYVITLHAIKSLKICGSVMQIFITGASLYNHMTGQQVKGVSSIKHDQLAYLTILDCLTGQC